MVVVMKENATEDQIQQVIARLVDMNFDVHRSTGVSKTVLGAIGDKRGIDPRTIEVLDGVHEVLRITEPYKLAGRTFHAEDTRIKIKDVEIGGNEVVVMAGPCSVESEEQIDTIAAAVKKAGAKILRGGAFKPRTSPYSFQGLGEKGLRMLRDAADRHQLLVVSEVMDRSRVPLLMEYADILQVGARNMQNYDLLKALGKIRRPVLLKRGMAATIEETLMSAEYIMAGGNYEVILCERGIRTFENYTRNTMDISAIPVLQKLTHLPVIADPSHGTGIRDKVAPMARAAVAAGAHGLLIEVHHRPDLALSDGPQSLYPHQFEKLMLECAIIAKAIGKYIDLKTKDDVVVAARS
ncbi:MAG: 3-deoxy-7-phosphoheptulonate synthase [Calditrichaeota bacterium]|nr:MAG: 3-deoxy-7-phosphoheptulonate synthase [Calditrichota bacterium]